MIKNNFHFHIQKYKYIFWDFDGVIKESLDVKTNAFENLFKSYGPEIAERVRNHHLENIGISRYKKIPLYLSWVNEPISNQNIRTFCKNFSEIVVENVIKSPWVPGFLEFINSTYGIKSNMLVTSTPQKEIDMILKKLDIQIFFEKVFGAETAKNKSIRICIDRMKIDQCDCLMIGDTETDLKAAEENNISFLLRKTHLNNKLQSNMTMNQFSNYL
mgnify:CR=1 FL=1